MPGKSGEQVQNETKDQAQGTANAAQEKAQSASQSAQDSASSAAGTAQEKAQGAQQQASETAQTWSETAQQKAAGLQESAGQYQSQAGDTVKGFGGTAQKTGEQYVQSGSDAANNAAKSYLPESAQTYAGSAVGYASNFATGTVGAVGGGVKDVGDTVANAGYETVSGVGKAGYGLGSNLGNAVTGKKDDGAANDAAATPAGSKTT
jgi:hypothetical protein